MSVAASESPKALRRGSLKAKLLLIAFYVRAAFVQPVAGGQVENRGKRGLPLARFTLQPGLEIGGNAPTVDFVLSLVDYGAVPAFSASPFPSTPFQTVLAVFPHTA